MNRIETDFTLKLFLATSVLFRDVVYNIALKIFFRVVSRLFVCLFVSTLKNLKTTTQMLMKLGQRYFKGITHLCTNFQQHS